MLQLEIWNVIQIQPGETRYTYGDAKFEDPGSNISKVMIKNETGSKYAVAILEYKFYHFRQYAVIAAITVYHYCQIAGL